MAVALDRDSIYARPDHAEMAVQCAQSTQVGAIVGLTDDGLEVIS